MQQVSPSILEKMVTNTGVTVLQLSKKHKILLIFLRYFQCAVCKATIDDVKNIFPTIIKMNAIPVFVHMESKAIADKFFSSWNSDIVKNFLRVEDPTGRLFYDHFGIKDFPMYQCFQPNVMPKFSLLALKYGNNPWLVQEKSRVSLQRYPGLFILENGQVVNSFKFKTFITKADFVRVLIDPDEKGKCSEACMPLQCVEDICKYYQSDNIPQESKKIQKNQKKPNNFQAFRSFTECYSPKVIPEEIDLDYVLTNPTARRFFKVYCSKEFSIENILFLEHVEKYEKAKDRKSLAKSIIKSFLTENAVNELNVNSGIKEKIKERFSKEGAVQDLFLEIIQELKYSVIRDTFIRFSQSKLFDEMVIKLKQK